MTQAIIMAAGLGSRLGDMTAALPKALIEVGGRPLEPGVRPIRTKSFGDVPACESAGDR